MIARSRKIHNYWLSDLLHWAEKLFITNGLYFGHGTATAWDEAVAVASYVLDLNLYKDILKDQKLSDQQVILFVKIVKERAKTKKPLGYIIKVAWFAGKKYYVDNRVIIPRSPFAELIFNRFKPWINFRPNSILDLCTGSCCIAIACWYAFAKKDAVLKIDASDKSLKALKVAAKNLDLHKLAGRINLFRSDLFKNIPDHKYDLILSNPPYVDQKTFNDLPKEFHYEPKIALLSSNNGLDIVNNILVNVEKFLSDRGVLILEVGYAWKKLSKLYPNIKFNWISLKNGGEGICVLTKKQLINY